MNKLGAGYQLPSKSFMGRIRIKYCNLFDFINLFVVIVYNQLAQLAYKTNTSSKKKLCSRGSFASHVILISAKQFLNLLCNNIIEKVIIIISDTIMV